MNGPFRLVLRVLATLAITLTFTVTGQAKVAFVLLDSLPDATDVDGYAYSISSDGHSVVGESNNKPIRWEVFGGSNTAFGLGALPGGVGFGVARDVSSDGSVVIGESNTNEGTKAFRWTSEGGMLDLGFQEGWSDSYAWGVSGDGSIVCGDAFDGSTPENAYRWTTSTGYQLLPELPNIAVEAAAFNLSADGQYIVGYNYTSQGLRATRWLGNGAPLNLGVLPGRSNSRAFGVSANGLTVVGEAYWPNSDSEAFRWIEGVGMVGLGDLPGGDFTSRANAVSADGSVVVGSGHDSTRQAIVWDQVQGMRKVHSILSNAGVHISGWQLEDGNDISADGRTIVGTARNSSGETQAWLAYLSDKVDWMGGSGYWDEGRRWTGPALPSGVDDVTIASATAAVVQGPLNNATVNSLKIGGGGAPRTTLQLYSGNVSANDGVTILNNGGLVLGPGRTLTSPTLNNSGVISGSGLIAANLANAASGELRVAPLDSLELNGTTHVNAGKIEVAGGSFEVIGAMTNSASTGLIAAQSGALRFSGNLTNAGSLAATAGLNNVSGDITNAVGGKITVTGGASAVFYDDVVQNGTLRVAKVGSSTSTAVFLGSFTGAGGSTGGGDIFFEGDLRPGNSPAVVTLDNNIAFGSTSTMHIELGGTTPGSGYDQIHVTGALSLDGTLLVELIDGFTPSAGQTFDVLDWGSRTGTFYTLALPSVSGLAWDVSQLYTSGMLSLTPSFTADFDEDGDVDGNDLTEWRNDFGAGNGSDADGDNDSDGQDFLAWQRQLGSVPAVAAAAAVPEPAGKWLALVAATAMACGHIRRNRLGRRGDVWRVAAYAVNWRRDCSATH